MNQKEIEKIKNIMDANKDNELTIHETYYCVYLRAYACEQQKDFQISSCRTDYRTAKKIQEECHDVLPWTNGFSEDMNGKHDIDYDEGYINIHMSYGVPRPENITDKEMYGVYDCSFRKRNIRTYQDGGYSTSYDHIEKYEIEKVCATLEDTIFKGSETECELFVISTLSKTSQGRESANYKWLKEKNGQLIINYDYMVNKHTDKNTHESFDLSHAKIEALNSAVQSVYNFFNEPEDWFYKETQYGFDSNDHEAAKEAWKYLSYTERMEGLTKGNRILFKKTLDHFYNVMVLSKEIVDVLLPKKENSTSKEKQYYLVDNEDRDYDNSGTFSIIDIWPKSDDLVRFIGSIDECKREKQRIIKDLNKDPYSDDPDAAEKYYASLRDF